MQYSLLLLRMHIWMYSYWSYFDYWLNLLYVQYVLLLHLIYIYCHWTWVYYSFTTVHVCPFIRSWFRERTLTPFLTSSCGSTWVTPGTTFTRLSPQRLRRSCRTFTWSCANRTRQPTAHPSPPASWSPSSGSQRST